MTQSQDALSEQAVYGRPLPFFTIVIAIHNAASDLAETLDDLRQQDCSAFEVLIADANSTDHPERHMQGLGFPLRHLVQSDTGIYDAWNKVLPLARGEWVAFMGAGDTFLSSTSLSEVAVALREMPNEVLLAYGRVRMIGENGNFLRECGAPWPEILESIRKFDGFPHQATFQRRQSYATYGLFDENFRIAGDTEMFLRLARHAAPVHFPTTVSNFKSGGTSSVASRRLASVREITAALRQHGNQPASRHQIWKAMLVNWLRILLPKILFQRSIDIYRRLTGRPARYE